MNLGAVINELVEERGLDRDTLSSIVCEGMLAAYAKRYPDLELKVNYNKKTDEMSVSIEKDVVSHVADEDLQISLKKARNINKKLEIGDKIWVPFEDGIGRIEILRAKQVIATKIRMVEALAVYNEFKDKEGTIVYGVVHKIERGGVVVKLQDHMAFLPKGLSIPGEKVNVGFSVRALLKEVLAEPRNENQLILDRASEDFLRQLLELEIPEIFEKLVNIEKIVRTAGYKSKIVVSSSDPNIDPVGTCVGVGGSRIKPILQELGNEKIDVIAETENIEELVKGSLKPAEINRVEIVDDNVANVWLDEEQRSLAIGRGGQNISLAARLVGMSIQLVQNNKKAEIDQDPSEEPEGLE